MQEFFGWIDRSHPAVLVAALLGIWLALEVIARSLKRKFTKEVARKFGISFDGSSH